jgi:hypothetical protein
MTKLGAILGLSASLAAGAVILAAGSCSDEGTSSGADPTTTVAGGASSSAGGGATTASGGGGAAATGGGPVGGSSPAGGSPPAIDYCTSCTAPVVAGALANGAIGEASGLGASRIHAGLLYVNNDSGDSARFFAVDSSGADQGTFNVGGATATDWEDMAVGPCGNGSSCVYLADVGDNDEARGNCSVYRVAEPSSVGVGAHSVDAERLRFEYPDGSHNCETLLVHPVSGELAVVTKVDSGPSGIYRFPTPLDPGSTAALEKVGEVTPPEGSSLFTGGDVHPQGRGILLRTYSHVWFFPGESDETIAEVLGHAPCSLPVGDEPQGETVAWATTADRYFTVSEGAESPIHEVSCSARR